MACTASRVRRIRAGRERRDRRGSDRATEPRLRRVGIVETRRLSGRRGAGRSIGGGDRDAARHPIPIPSPTPDPVPIHAGARPARAGADVDACRGARPDGRAPRRSRRPDGAARGRRRRASGGRHRSRAGIRSARTRMPRTSIRGSRRCWRACSSIRSPATIPASIPPSWATEVAGILAPAAAGDRGARRPGIARRFGDGARLAVPRSGARISIPSSRSKPRRRRRSPVGQGQDPQGLAADRHVRRRLGRVLSAHPPEPARYREAYLRILAIAYARDHRGRIRGAARSRSRARRSC